MRKFFIVVFAFFYSLALNQVYAKEIIRIFHAGSLSVPFKKISIAFEKRHPEFIVEREPSGSVMAARKIVDLHKPCDVMASADYEVINNLLIKTGNAKFNALFATNEMALVYTDKSRYSKAINSKNWPYILMKKDVIIGHSNPNDDPCGYRAMLVVKLAEKYYHIKGFFKNLFGYPDFYTVGMEKKGKVIVRPKETDLLALLKLHLVDYIFLYKSVAIQHHLKYIKLPPQISLSSFKYKSFYSTVSFKIEGASPKKYITVKGKPMIYSLTIPQNENSPPNKRGAVMFVKFVLSKVGQRIMKECGQGVITPPKILGDPNILKEQ